MKFMSGAVVCLVVILSMLTACSSDKKPTDPGNGDGDWAYGTTRTYDVDLSFDDSITDTSTGVTLRFPEGGYGTMIISEIIAAPSTPGEGAGFKIEYDGYDPVFLEVDTAAGLYAAAYGYGKVSGIFDDETGNGDRWAALPREEVNGNVISFILMFPQTLAKPAGPAQQAIGFDHYWINRNTATTDEVEQRVNISLQVGTYVDQFLSVLPTALRTTVESKVRSTHRRNADYDGNYYCGFWWRSLGSYGRILKPTIHVRLPSTATTVAHETSHYLAHVLNTDDFQSALEGQAGFFDNHGIRDNVGRNVVLEEYAYFGEYFFTGTGGNYNLAEPYDVFRNLTPLTVDFPSLEGFGAVLLAQLVRTGGTIRDIVSGRDVNVPVIGMNYGQAFEIISQGALGIEQLRTNIETAVGTANRSRLDGILQRIGWNYGVQGTLVDENDVPVQGALVSNVLTIGSDVYEGGYSSIPSGSDGAFRIVGQVFPGNSTLRVISGTDTTDVDINVAYSNQTNQTVDIGEIRVEGLLAKIKRTTQLTGSIKCGVPHTWNWYNSNTGTSGQYPQNRYSWDFSAGVWSEEPDLTWTNNSFTFQFTGSRLGQIFSPPQAGSLPQSDWVNTITGTVDRTGKLLTANISIHRTDQSYWTPGKVEFIEIALHDMDPSYIAPSGNSVYVSWNLTKDDVAGHLSILSAGTHYGTQTDTYVSTDWQNGYDCYWNTPLDGVFSISIRP